MDALVMCGGRGTRLGGDTEKPLTPVRGRQMVDRVCDALAESRVGMTYAVVSPHAPETRGHIEERIGESGGGDSRLRIVDAPGEGYVADLRCALDTPPFDTSPLDDSRVLTVAADLPLLDGEAVDAVIAAARNAGSGSVAVHVPAARKRELGVSADTATVIDGRELVPAGINVVSTDGDGDGNEDTSGNGGGKTGGNEDTAADGGENGTVHVTDDRRVAVNVNYPSDLWIAEALLSATADRSTGGDPQ